MATQTEWLTFLSAVQKMRAAQVVAQKGMRVFATRADAEACLACEARVDEAVRALSAEPDPLHRLADDGGPLAEGTP